MAAQPSPPPGQFQQPDATPGPPAPARARRTTVWVVVVVAVILVVAAVGAIALLRDDASPTPEASTTAQATDEAPTATEEPTGPSGTREDPYAAGDPVTAGGWTTTIGPTDTDAWTALSADLGEVERTQLAPPEGTSYVVAPMTVTFADGQPSDLGSFEVSYVGVSGTAYPVIGSTCRLALTDLFPTSDVYDEPEVSGTVCTDVPTTDAPGGTWRVALNIYDDAASASSKDYEGYVAVD